MLRKHKPPNRQSDRQDLWAHRVAVTTLALTVVVCAAGAIVLQVCGKPTPDLLTTLAPCAIAGLAGIVSPRPTSA